MRFEITIEQLQQLVSYLSQRPAGEVFDLLLMVRGLPAIAEAESTGGAKRK